MECSNDLLKAHTNRAVNISIGTIRSTPTLFDSIRFASPNLIICRHFKLRMWSAIGTIQLLKILNRDWDATIHERDSNKRRKKNDHLSNSQFLKMINLWIMVMRNQLNWLKLWLILILMYIIGGEHHMDNALYCTARLSWFCSDFSLLILCRTERAAIQI